MPATSLSAFATSEGLLATVCLALLPAGAADPTERELGTDVAVPEAVLALIRAEITTGNDPIGDVFCGLRSAAERRDLGQFYTPDPIVAAMCDWVLRQSPVRAIDGGCGSGRYAVALRRAGFTGDLIAVDVDPLATLMTKAHAAAANVRVDVRRTSFLELALPTVAGPTVWFGNPPYLRHHNLPAAAKSWAKRAAAGLGVKVSGLAGLHALFFLAVAANGSEGDAGCFITSSEWFDARYGSVVRDLLTGATPLRRLDVVPPETLAFADATTTAVITSFRVGQIDEREDPLLRVVTDPTALQSLDDGDPLSRDDLRGRESWSGLLPGAAQAATGDHLVPLRTHMKVSRGLATGNNKFFAPTRSAADAAGLGDYAVPLVAKAADVLNAVDGNVDPDRLQRVLLDLPADLPDDPALATYLASGVEQSVPDGYICANRTNWWRVGLPAPAPILATYMARQAPVFVRNPAGAANLNNCHGLRPVEGFPDELVPVLATWLNEHRDELVGGRTYAGGLRKVEPRDMEGFMVPDLATLRTLAGA